VVDNRLRTHWASEFSPVPPYFARAGIVCELITLDLCPAGERAEQAWHNSPTFFPPSNLTMPLRVSRPHLLQEIPSDCLTIFHKPIEISRPEDKLTISSIFATRKHAWGAEYNTSVLSMVPDSIFEDIAVQKLNSQPVARSPHWTAPTR
jgi:hypothetical protein